MRNRQDGNVSAGMAQRVTNRSITEHVNTRGCLVEHDYFRVDQQRPCKAEKLALPLAKIAALLADRGIKPPIASIVSDRPTISSACHSCRSEQRPHRSRLLRIVPSRRIGSCGTTLSAVRSRSSGMRQCSIPPMRTRPRSGSTNRKSAWKSVLFPEPVRPTIPTCAPAGISMLTSRRTHGKCGA